MLLLSWNYTVLLVVDLPRSPYFWKMPLGMNFPTVGQIKSIHLWPVFFPLWEEPLLCFSGVRDRERRLTFFPLVLIEGEWGRALGRGGEREKFHAGLGAYTLSHSPEVMPKSGVGKSRLGCLTD